MSFATDYVTAYRLLRSGMGNTSAFDKTFPNLRLLCNTIARQGRFPDWLNLEKRVGVHGRIEAAVMAFKLARSLRKAKILASVIHPENVDDKTELKDEHVKVKRPITLFPITVNRTTIQMKND